MSDQSYMGRKQLINSHIIQEIFRVIFLNYGIGRNPTAFIPKDWVCPYAVRSSRARTQCAPWQPSSRQAALSPFSLLEDWD